MDSHLLRRSYHVLKVDRDGVEVQGQVQFDGLSKRRSGAVDR